MVNHVLIVKTGSSVSAAGDRFGDFDDWFVNSIGQDRFKYQTISVQDGERLPESLEGLGGVIVTGSPAMVSHRHEWSEQAAAWLADAFRTGLPMLGVCYGHQLIAHALGGSVGPNPNGRRMGTLAVEIVDNNDLLLGEFSPSQYFQATHVEAVLEPPPGARVIARSDGDEYHGLYFGQAAWGLQFHPEFDRDIMDCYVRSRASVLSGEGIYAQRILDSLRATPSGPKVLRRFADLVDAAPPRFSDAESIAD
jgi:GMP synthase (glutamine-hydrolysing)